jgi:glycerol-3-phosphate dehydrogenase
MEMLRRVAARGGAALNYVQATGWRLGDGNRVRGVEARDLVTDTQMTFAARAVLNCTGPWARDLDGPNWPAGTEGHAPSLAFNLLLDYPLDTAATVAVQPAGGGRTYFLHPMGTRTLAGTYHAAADGPGETPNETQISDFIGDLRAAIPGFDPARSDVLRVLAGTLPARRAGTDDVETRDLWVDVGARGGPEGLFTLVGVKYTTAPLAAKRAVESITQRCFPRVGGADDGMMEPAPRTVPAWQEFADLVRDNREQARALVQTIVDDEGVTTVEDLLLRRVDWGLVPSEFDEAAKLARSWFPELVSGRTQPGSG